MTRAIAKLLAGLDAPGTFATRLRAPADDLSVEVRGVGRLRFPIAASTAERLRRVARPAPFGLREETLHDPSVRRTWEIPKARVKIAARPWRRALSAHLATMQRQLGLPADCQLAPELDKLLLYERGQFFKAHQDSEKSDDMVGSLVVLLPSRYSGGSLTVAHQGEKKSFRRLEHQGGDLSLLAFYADCQHEVAPIKSGHRIALTYHLRLKEGAGAPPAPLDSKLVEELAARMRTHFETPIEHRYSRREPRPPARLAYLLDHHYTQRSLGWRRLKAADRRRVEALRAAAEKLDCESFLALADVHETWNCVEEDPYADFHGYRSLYRGYRQRYGRDGERARNDYSDRLQLGELEDRTVQLLHWVGLEGDSVASVSDTVDEDELCFTTPSHDLEPFQSEYEGYQGNYGNTLDRWYHRAALLTWPRANAFFLRARISPSWALDELANIAPEATSDLESRVEQLLPDWTSSARSETSARFFTKLTKVAARLSSPELAAAFVEPLGLQRLGSRATRNGLAALVNIHGLAWGRDRFEAWAPRPGWSSDWRRNLADLCSDLARAGGPSRELAAWLVEREVGGARESAVRAASRSVPFLALGGFAREAEQLAHVLAAAAEIDAHTQIDDTLAALARKRHGLPLPLRIATLEALAARSPALRTHAAGSSLHLSVVAELDALLAAPARARGDWSISHRLSCSCRDCSELEQFLRSSDVARDWPLAKARRQHMHNVLDENALPVTHSTVRRGRPFVLQLRKERALFSREAAYAKALRTTRRALDRSLKSGRLAKATRTSG